MPAEIKDKEELEVIIKRTIEQNGICRTKRVKDGVKLKFRTKKRLYTIKLSINEAEALIKELSSKIHIEPIT